MKRSILNWHDRLFGDKLMKMNFAKHDVIVVNEELTAARERMHKIVVVREIAASHILYQMNNIRLLEKLAAWRRTNGLDINEVLAERQRMIQGHVCSVDGLGYSQIEVYFDPRRPSSLQQFTESIWAEINRLRQEILPPHSRCSAISPRHDRMHDHRHSSCVLLPG